MSHTKTKALSVILEELGFTAHTERKERIWVKSSHEEKPAVIIEEPHAKGYWPTDSIRIDDAFLPQINAREFVTIKGATTLCFESDVDNEEAPVLHLDTLKFQGSNYLTIPAGNHHLAYLYLTDSLLMNWQPLNLSATRSTCQKFTHQPDDHHRLSTANGHLTLIDAQLNDCHLERSNAHHLIQEKKLRGLDISSTLNRVLDDAHEVDFGHLRGTTDPLASTLGQTFTAPNDNFDIHLKAHKVYVEEYFSGKRNEFVMVSVNKALFTLTEFETTINIPDHQWDAYLQKSRSEYRRSILMIMKTIEDLRFEYQEWIEDVRQTLDIENVNN